MTHDNKPEVSEARLVLDALWPVLGGSHVRPDDWYKISDAVHKALAQAHAQPQDHIPDAGKKVQPQGEAGELAKALKPFADFGGNNWAVDDEGWVANTGNERLCDWFGPSDFRNAAMALRAAPSGEPVGYSYEYLSATGRCWIKDAQLGERPKSLGSSKVRNITPLYAGASDPDFQTRIDEWMKATFPKEVREDQIERSMRFLEEATELCQSIGLTADKAHTVIDYVFGRPVGDPPQEVGGTMVTLAALCCAIGWDMDDCGEGELARINTPEMRKKIAAKQVSKRLFGMSGPSYAGASDADATD